MANDTLNFIVITKDEYIKLIETRTRYNILADHIRKELKRDKNYPSYNDGLFKAVVCREEEETC